MKNFTGVFTALITPFNNQQVDYVSLEKLIKFQLDLQVDGFVVHGTTAESPTVSKEEKKEIFKFIKGKVPSGFPLIVGTGTNSTSETINASKEAQSWGADGLLLVVPYYNKPPQRGLYEHFKAIADAVNIPCLLYNVPGRTVTSLEADTIQKLSEHPRIVGIKEATGNIQFAKEIRQKCGEKFIMLTGDDGTYDEFMAAGGNGVISVASHIFVKPFKERKVSQYKDLVDYLFIEANPIPVKRALQLMGVISSAELRLPLVELSEKHTVGLKDLLQKKGLLK